MQFNFPDAFLCSQYLLVIFNTQISDVFKVGERPGEKFYVFSFSLFPPFSMTFDKANMVCLVWVNKVVKVSIWNYDSVDTYVYTDDAFSYLHSPIPASDMQSVFLCVLARWYTSQPVHLGLVDKMDLSIAVRCVVDLAQNCSVSKNRYFMIVY